MLLAAIGPALAQTMARPGWAGSGLNAETWWQHAVFLKIDGGQKMKIDGSPANQVDANHAPLHQDVDFKAIAGRLDGLQAIGIDALILPMPGLPAQVPAGTRARDPGADGTANTASATAAKPDAMGDGSGAPHDLGDFDELIRQASRHSMRVLLTFTASGDTGILPATAQFWLSRGVAGFELVTPPETSPRDSQTMAQTLRKITGGAAGQRIVISNFNPDRSDSPASAAGRRETTLGGDGRHGDAAGAQLQIDSRMSRIELPEAANLRPLLAASVAEPNVFLEFHPPPAQAGSPGGNGALAKAVAAILLTTHSAALIDADENLALPAGALPTPDAAEAWSAAPPVPASRTAAPAMTPRAASLPGAELSDWYRQLSRLHHGNATLEYGSVTTLNFDEQNALVWVSRPASSAGLAPAVVVACNLSATPVELSLSAAIKGLGLHGSFLRTLLRSDAAMGAQNLNLVTLPPFGVYIGELRR